MAIENSDMKQTCKDNGNFNIVDGILVEYLGDDSSVVIPDGVTKINDYVFLNHNVTSVSIPVTVKKINEYAFNTLTDIRYAGTREQWNNVRKSIYLGRHMRADVVHCVDGDVELPHFDIRDNVLEHYYGASDSVVIPENVNRIGDAAFAYCKFLVSITIPDGVTEIGERAFSSCKSLKSIVIPDSVIEIEESTFQDCESLKSVVIPDGVTIICDEAFRGCTSLVSLVIPCGVTEIGIGAFMQCRQCSSVTIPDSVRVIGSDAFFDCGLSSISIPSSLEELGSSAFAFSGLREIRYAGTKEEWENIRKGALWNDHVPAKKVICTDGDVELENNATDIAPAVDIVSIGVDSESKMVTIPGTDYMMGQTPVTQRLYQKVMGVNPSYYQLSNEKLREDQRKALEEEGDTSNNPVEWITWYDALYFCNKLSMMEGLTPAYSVNGKTDPKCWDYTLHHQRGEDIDFDVDFDCTASGYRLPTKYEWNYAARGGENYIYSGSNDLDKVGWYSKNSKNVTHPVAQKLANGYGLYDMSGNVSEWGWGFWNLFGRRQYCWCHKFGGELLSDACHCELPCSRYSMACCKYNYTGFRLLRHQDCEES